jgi:hypothetical protein
LHYWGPLLASFFSLSKKKEKLDMLRLSKVALQALKKPIIHQRIVPHSRVITAPIVNLTWRHNFSHLSFAMSTPKDNQHKEEDDLEVIDPKDFPELYPENSEQIEFDENDEDVDKEWFVDPEYAEEKQLSETDFIPMWQRRAVGDHLEDRLALQQVSKELMESGKLTAESLCSLLEESKMDDVKVIDVREKCDWAEYMIIASSPKGDKYLSSVAEHIGGVVSWNLL